MANTLSLNRVTYPGIEANGRPLVVERVQYGREILVARGAQQLLRRAYERQFERSAGPLSPGAIRSHLANENNPYKVVRQAARMREAINDGSDYWVAREPGKRGHLLALAKITAGADHVYINDVLSADTNNGYGSAVLHTALKFGGLRSDTPVELDGFAGSTVNNWFENMGLQLEGYSEGSFRVGDERLSQVHYAGAAIGDLTTYMAVQHPALHLPDLR